MRTDAIPGPAVPVQPTKARAWSRAAVYGSLSAASEIVVDETGPFELSGGGWASALDRLAQNYEVTLLLVARASVVDAVRARWGSPATFIVDVTSSSAEALAALIFADRAASGPVVT
jgi:nucleoside-triphosphatase THEP1